MQRIIKFSMAKMNLSVVDFEKNCVIKSIEIKDLNLKNQLNNLGFVVDEKIKVMKINYGKTSYLVKVMGVNYALDKKIAEGIFVEYE